MILTRVKTLSKTPPKVAGPPPATTFFHISIFNTKRLSLNDIKPISDCMKD